MKKVFQRLVAMALAVVMFGGDAVAVAETLATLMLPASLKVIEEEAFMGTSVDQIVIPQGAEEIGERAFADGSIGEIIVPESVKHIADNAFENTTLQAFTAEEDTYAYAWGVSNGFIKEDEDQLAPVITSCTLENGTGIHLVWEKHEDTSNSYRIDYATHDFVEEKHIYSTFMWECEEQTIYGLKPNTTYYVRITAFDQDYFEHTSKTVSVTTTVAAQEIPITKLSVNGEVMDFSWRGGSLGEVDSYSRRWIEVEPANASNQQFRWVSSDPCVASVDENTGLITCNNYGWTEITAYATDGSGLSLTGWYSVGPMYPQTLEAVVNETSITVWWEAVEDADFYFISCFDPISGDDRWEDGVKNLEYTFSDLLPNTEYQISVWSAKYTGEDSYIYSWTSQDVYAITGEEKQDITPQVSCSVEEAYVGDTVTWTVQVFNGTEPYEYEFNVYQNGKWKGTYSRLDPNYSRTFEEVGEYYVVVEIMDMNGTHLYELYSETITVLEPGATHVKFFTWTKLSASYAEITGYTGTDTKVVIPSKIGNYSISAIGDWAFSRNTNLTSITIPEGVHTIGRDAFSGCSNLTDVHLPESLKTIDEYAFYQCSRLHNLRIPDGVTSIISEYSNIFYGCDDLIIYCNAGTTAALQVTNVEKRFVDPDYPDFFLSKHTQNSEYYLTVRGYATDVSSLSIPAAIDGVPVTKIADNAFKDNMNLLDIVFEGSLTSIGHSAFSGCSNLTNVVFTGTLTSIANYAFDGCNNLTCITLPDGLQSIGSFVFNNCSRLTKLVIPDSITAFQKLNSLAFSGCENLVIYCKAGNAAALQISTLQGKFVDLDYPDFYLAQSKQDSEYYLVVKGCAEDATRLSVPSTINNVPITQIAERAFENNKNLTNVVLNDNVTSIGREAFAHCRNLSAITLPDNITSLGWNAFVSCDKLIFYCNAGTVTASQITAENREFIDPSYPTLLLKQYSLDSEYYLAVYNCISGITSVYIPRTINNIPVTHIDDYAFKYAGEITNIYLSEGLTTIGSFDGCYNLIELIIPESVKSISYYPFPYSWDGQLYVYKGSYGEEWCIEHRYEYNYVTTPPTPPDVTLPTLPEGENSDFLYTIRNNEITIIGYTGTATDIIIPSKIGMYPVTEISEYTFADKYKITSITLPEGLKGIHEYAFENCTGLTRIQFPDSMDHIEEGAFRNCTNLSEIDINWECSFANTPGSSVFSGTNIKTIKIPEGVTYIPSNIFSSITSLTNVILPSTLKKIGSSAFYSCSGLTNIVLPEGLTEIDWWAFEHCTELTQVVLPSTLEEVGDYAFHNCGNPLFIVKEGTFAEEWCQKNNYRHDYASSSDDELIPYVFSYKINNTAREMTVKEGDLLTLSGTVYGGNANLNNLQVSILRADNQGLGVAFDRAENINAASYDLSAFDPIVVGQEYEDANQKLTMQAGYSYLIMLHASDVSGIGFGDLDPTVEGHQGPSIKVTVIEDSDYRFAVSGGAENGLTASHWGGMGMNVTVASVGKWTVESDSEWMTTNVSSGESGDSFYAIIEQNKEYENRYGYLTLSCDGFNPISIKVTQNGIPRRVELKIFQPDPKRITQDSAWVCGQLIWGENETASNYCLAGIQYGIVGEPWEDSVFIDPSMDDDTALDPKTGKYWLQIGGLTSGALYRFRSVAQRADGTWLPESDEVTVRITDYCEHQYSQMYYAYADEVKAHREAYIAEGNSFLPEIFLHEDETLTTHAIRFPYIQLCDLCENYNVTYTTAAETSQEHTWIVENTIRYDNISKTTHDAYPYLITRCNSTVGNDECGYVFSEDAGVPSLEEAHVYVDGVCACGYCNVVWEGSINDNKLQIDVQVVKGQPDANKTYLFIAENDAGSHYTYSIPKGTTSAAITFKSDLGLPRAQHYTFYILPEDVMLDENNQEEYRLFDAVVPLYAGNMITSISSGSNQNSNNELLIGEDVIIHWDGSFGVNSTTVVAKANDNVVYSKTFDHDGPGIIIIPYENIAPYVSAAVSGVISRVVDKMEVVVTVNPPALSGLAPISSTWTGYFVQKPEGKYSIYLSWNGIPETECTFDGTTNIGINVTDQYYPLAVVSGNSDYFGLRAYLDGKPLTLTDPNSEYEWVFAGTGTDLAGTEGTTDIAYQYPRYYTEGGFELGEKTWIIKDFNDGFTFQYNKNMIGLKHSIELRIKGSEERLAWFTPIVYDKQVFTVYGKDVGYGKNDAAYSGRVDLPISQSTFWESASLEQKRLLFDLNYKRMLIESMIPSYTVEEFLNACGEERAFDLKTGFVQLMLNIGTVVTGTLGDIAEYIVDLGKLVIWDIGLLVSGGPTMDTMDRSIELSENVLDSFGEDNTIRKMITHDSGFVDAIVESLVQTARVEQQKSNPNRMADTQAEMVYRFFDGLFSSGNEKSIEVIKECLNLVFEQNIDNVNWDACGDIFVGYRDGSSVNLKFNEVFRLDILEDLTSLEQTLFYEMLDPEANRSVNRFKDPQYKFFWDSFGEEWQDVAYEALPQTSPIRSQININRLYKEVEKWLDLGDCLFAGYDAYRMADMYDKALAQLKENMPSLIQQYSDTHNKDMSAYDAAWLDSLLEELTISTSNQMEKVLTAIVTKAVEQGIEEISSQMLKEVCEEVIEEIAKKIGKDGVGKVAAVASRAAGYVTAVWYGIDIALFLSDAESTVGRIPTFKELYKMYQDTQVDLREAISRYVESPSEDNFNAVKQLVYIYNITKGSCITTQYSVYIKEQQSIRARFSNFTSWYRNTRNNLFDAIFTGDWKKYVEELQTDIRKSRIASYEEAMAGELMQMKELINVMFPQIP